MGQCWWMRQKSQLDVEELLQIMSWKLVFQLLVKYLLLTYILMNFYSDLLIV